jgi:Rieske Fe-S protein
MNKKIDANTIKSGTAIVQDNVAVYKDKAGKIHACSAVCTHMGCIVRWNNAEDTWDCPCHGSRFSVDGKVIHGPAVKDLKKLKLKKTAEDYKPKEKFTILNPR